MKAIDALGANKRAIANLKKLPLGLNTLSASDVHLCNSVFQLLQFAYPDVSPNGK